MEIKKEITLNDRKWIFEKDERGNYTIKYLEYHRQCNYWSPVGIDKDNSEEVVRDYQQHIIEEYS